MYIYMYELENMLLQMQEHLEKVVTQAKADLNTTVPEGHLRISIDKNKPRYYQCIDDNKGVYIPRDNKELPKRLAQKGYNKAVVKKGEARLDSLGVVYQRIDHEAAMTMEACEEIDRVLEATICKNLLLCNRQETRFYLLMLPGDKVFKTKDLSAQIGSSRLSFAKAEYMEQYLDITPGSLSVLGLMNDKDKMVRLLIDEDVLTGEYIGCHPCINTSSLRLKTKDLVEKIIPAMEHEPTIVKL